MAKRSEAVPQDETEYTKKILKTELAEAIIWKAYFDRVNPYQLAKEFGVKNIRTIQYQIDSLNKLGFLNYIQPFDEKGRLKRTWWRLDPRFKIQFEENILNPWDSAMSDLSRRQDILTQSYFVVDEIRDQTKTLSEIQGSIGLPTQVVEFALHLFAPYIERRFRDGHFYYQVRRKLPVLISGNWRVDIEREKEVKFTILQTATQGARKVEAPIRIFVDSIGKERVGPNLGLSGGWVLIRANFEKRDFPMSKVCEEECRKQTEKPFIVKEVKAIPEIPISWEEEYGPPETQFDLCKRGIGDLINQTLRFPNLEKRECMVFWKCPKGKCYTDIKHGQGFIPPDSQQNSQNVFT
jgi:hypothetical protein